MSSTYPDSSHHVLITHLDKCSLISQKSQLCFWCMLTFIFISAEIEIMGTKLYPNLEYNHYQQARADFNVVKDI